MFKLCVITDSTVLQVCELLLHFFDHMPLNYTGSYIRAISIFTLHHSSTRSLNSLVHKRQTNVLTMSLGNYTAAAFLINQFIKIILIYIT